MDAADEVRRDSHTIRLMIDHRPLVTRLRHAWRGESGPAKLRVRPLVTGDGKKLDIDVA
jgi:hypothetical protein